MLAEQPVSLKTWCGHEAALCPPPHSVNPTGAGEIAYPALYRNATVLH